MRNKNIHMMNKKLTGFTVFGAWGVYAGWEYGIVIGEESGTHLGEDWKDVIIQWEDGRETREEISGLIEIKEETSLEGIGIFIDTVGCYLTPFKPETEINKENNAVINEEPSITQENEVAKESNTDYNLNNFNQLDTYDKLKALTHCFVDVMISLNARTYSFALLSEDDQQYVKSTFFKQLSDMNIVIPDEVPQKAKRLKRNLIFSLLTEYSANTEDAETSQEETIILTNENRYFNYDLQTIDSLVEEINASALDPEFEKHGNFIMPFNPVEWTEENIRYKDYTVISGNFYNNSNVFKILTNDREDITKLTEVIRRNQNTSAYEKAKRETEQQEQEELNRKRIKLYN